MSRAEILRRYRQSDRGKISIRGQVLRRKERNKSLIWEFRSRPCTDCGTVEPEIMEIDHIPEKGKKEFYPGAKLYLNTGSLLRELEKCEPVCPNCHTRRSNLRAGIKPAQPLMLQILHQDAKTPKMALEGDVGMDLHLLGNHTLQPGERRDLPTGIAMAMPDWIYARITGRSSSIRRGLMVFEGILDSGYRGPLFVFVQNLTEEPVQLKHHERLAQVVFAPALRPTLLQVAKLPESARGTSGLGSTGS